VRPVLPVPVVPPDVPMLARHGAPDATIRTASSVAVVSPPVLPAAAPL
jgi:hypothetical protein